MLVVFFDMFCNMNSSLGVWLSTQSTSVTFCAILAHDNQWIALYPLCLPELAKGLSFDAVKEIQHELQMGLDALKEREFQGAFQVWQSAWRSVWLKKGTLKGSVDKFKLATVFVFYSVVSELFDHMSYNNSIIYCVILCAV